MYEELSEIFSDHDNYLTSRELLMKVRTSVSSELVISMKSEVLTLFETSCQSSSLPQGPYVVL